MTIITKQDYLIKIDFDYLLRFASETKLYRNYRKYFTKKDFVNALLRNLTYDQCKNLYNAFINKIPPEEIAQFFMLENPTYDIIRDKLVKEYISKYTEEDEVIFFEFPVLNTRTDVTRVNGISYNYEIKTSRDKVERLQNQMATFTTVFERNLVVCSEKLYEHVLNYIPPNVGVIVYEIHGNMYYFKEKIRPKKSKNLKSENQLKILTTERLKTIYKKKIGKITSLSRSQLIEKILTQLTDYEINKEFKLYLKEKYSHINHLQKNFY